MLLAEWKTRAAVVVPSKGQDRDDVNVFVVWYGRRIETTQEGGLTGRAEGVESDSHRDGR